MLTKVLQKEINERKLAEEALKQSNRELMKKNVELEEANKELSQYAYVVSHDVRAPLRAVHNYADFMREDLDGKLEEEQQIYLDELGNAVLQAEELVSDLLALSRIGRLSAPIEKLNMGAFLSQLINSLSLPGNIEIKMSEHWPAVYVKPVLYRQIF